MLLLINLNVFGQSHQEQIIDFVNKNKGCKIGTGLCYELVEAAIQTFNPSFDGTLSKKNRYGTPVKLSNVMPGDIVFMSGGSKRSINHVAIVYSVNGDDIYLAEQNTKGNLRDSKVVVRFLSYSTLEDYYGKITYKFYHPS